MRKKPQTLLEIVGENLRIARSLRGLSQAELGAKIGRRQEIISKYETGKLTIPITELVLIAEALDSMPGDFFKGLSIFQNEADLLSNLEWWIEKHRRDVHERLLVYHFNFVGDKNRFKLNSLSNLCDLIVTAL